MSRITMYTHTFLTVGILVGCATTCPSEKPHLG